MIDLKTQISYKTCTDLKTLDLETQWDTGLISVLIFH